MTWRPNKGVTYGVIVDVCESKLVDSGVSVNVREDGMPENWSVSLDKADFDFEPEVGMEVEFEIVTHVLSDEDEEPYNNTYEVVDIREDGTVEGRLVDSFRLRKEVGDEYTERIIEDGQPRLFTARELDGREVSLGDILRTRLVTDVQPYAKTE